jgi:M6 family metalloprotease-like protein
MKLRGRVSLDRAGERRRKMKRCWLAISSVLVMVFVAAAPLFAAMVSQEAIDEQRVLVIMAKFPGIEPLFSAEKMRNKYFDKLDRYLRAISYGKTWIKGKMTRWHTLSQRVDNYRISQHNLAVNKGRVMTLINDAVNLVDKEEDFSHYSMIFVSLGAKRNDYGMMGLCGYPGMLGWKSELPLCTKERGQKIPGGVAIYCEQAHVGIVFHDMAHIMGGVQGGRRVLPCLYDHDLQAKSGPFRNHFQFYLTNVGFFDPMSCHYYKLRQGPPGVCAWTKLRFNWINPQKIIKVPRGQSKTVLLGPLSRKDSKVQVVMLPVDATTYYLIENRQPIGPDRNLPAHGLLIYSCDDTIPECRHGSSPIKLVNARPEIPHLEGAAFTLEGKHTYENERHGISIKLLDQRGESYRISVSNGLL